MAVAGTEGQGVDHCARQCIDRVEQAPEILIVTGPDQEVPAADGREALARAGHDDFGARLAQMRGDRFAAFFGCEHEPGAGGANLLGLVDDRGRKTVPDRKIRPPVHVVDPALDDRRRRTDQAGSTVHPVPAPLKRVRRQRNSTRAARMQRCPAYLHARQPQPCHRPGEPVRRRAAIGSDHELGLAGLIPREAEFGGHLGGRGGRRPRPGYPADPHAELTQRGGDRQGYTGLAK